MAEEAEEIFIFRPKTADYFQYLIDNWSFRTQRKRKREEIGIEEYDERVLEIQLGRKPSLKEMIDAQNFSTRDLYILPNTDFTLVNSLPSGLFVLYFLKIIDENYVNSLVKTRSAIKNEFEFESVLKYIERKIFEERQPFSIYPYNMENWHERLSTILKNGEYTVASIRNNDGKNTTIIIYKVNNELQILRVGVNLEIIPVLEIIESDLFQSQIIVPIINRSNLPLNCKSNIVNPELYNFTCNDSLYAQYVEFLLENNNEDCKQEAKDKKDNLQKYKVICDKNLLNYREAERKYAEVLKKDNILLKPDVSRVIRRLNRIEHPIRVKNQDEMLRVINFYPEFSSEFINPKPFQRNRSDIVSVEDFPHTGNNCVFQVFHDVGIMGEQTATILNENPLFDLIKIFNKEEGSKLGCFPTVSWGFIKMISDSPYVIRVSTQPENFENLLKPHLKEGYITYFSYKYKGGAHAVSIYKENGELYVIDRQKSRGKTTGYLFRDYLNIPRSNPPLMFFSYWEAEGKKPIKSQLELVLPPRSDVY